MDQYIMIIPAHLISDLLKTKDMEEVKAINLACLNLSVASRKDQLSTATLQKFKDADITMIHQLVTAFEENPRYPFSLRGLRLKERQTILKVFPEILINLLPVTQELCKRYHKLN